MHLKPNYTLRENINELLEQGYKVGDNNNTVTYNINNMATKIDPPTYKRWCLFGIDRIKAARHRHGRDILIGFGKEAFRVLTYLTTFFFFLKCISRA